MSETAETKLAFTPSDTDDEMFSKIVSAFHLPDEPLKQYSIDRLLVLIGILFQIIRGLIKDKASADDRIEVLTFQAKKSSKTSSMRPSSDGYIGVGSHKVDPDALTEEDSEKLARKDHHRSRRRPSGKNPGQQPGEKSSGFQFSEKAVFEETKVIMPAHCLGCSRYQECLENSQKNAKRNVENAEVIVTVSSFRTATVICPKDGETYSGEYPEEARGTNNIGYSVRAFIATLVCAGMVSYERAREIVKGIFGINVSGYVAVESVRQLADKVKPAVEKITEALLKEDVVCCDETGVNINGKLCWIHTVATELYTFLSLQSKRGKEGMDAAGFLELYTGIVVHDCWASYWKFTNVEHGLCNGHVGRELQGLAKFFRNCKEWAEKMSDLLVEMDRVRNEAKAKGKTYLPKDVITEFEERYDEILAEGFALHPMPEQKEKKRGRKKRGKARSLLERMRDHKSEFLLFLHDFNVPFTSNEAEKSFRMVAIKRSVTGCFRTKQGAEDFVMIWSYLSSARKQDISYYEAVYQAFLGNAESLLFPEYAE